MTLTTKQLLQAYDGLNQGIACLDDNLRLGVLVYVESLLVEHGIPRDKYLTLENLHSHYPYVRMGSYMPIDFFSLGDEKSVTRSCNDVNFKPITLNLCTVSQKNGQKSVHRWHMVGTYRDDHIIEAIHELLATLSNKDYFNYCTSCNSIRPTGYLNDDMVCDCCCDELRSVA